MIIRLVIFNAVWIAVFLSVKFLEEMSNYLLPLPLILFFVLLSSYMKSLSNGDIKYEKGWKHSAFIAFLMGASLPLPFAIFRTTPDGPVMLSSAFDYFKFLTATLLSGVGFGLVSMLIGIIYINQFYPRRE